MKKLSIILITLLEHYVRKNLKLMLRDLLKLQTTCKVAKKVMINTASQYNHNIMLTFHSHRYWATQRSMFDFSDESTSTHLTSLHYQPAAKNPVHVSIQIILNLSYSTSVGRESLYPARGMAPMASSH